MTLRTRNNCTLRQPALCRNNSSVLTIWYVVAWGYKLHGLDKLFGITPDRSASLRLGDARGTIANVMTNNEHTDQTPRFVAP